MDKVVVYRDGEELGEVELTAKRMTLGRDPASDIPLNDLSVSRSHARLTKVFNDYFIEDLNSTNGTFLNDRAVTKHMVRDRDCLRIGSFELRFVLQQQGDDELDRTVVLQRPAAVARTAPARPAPAAPLAPKTAHLRFFRGPMKGMMERVERSLYTIGRPGSEVAAIARRPQGFFLLHIGGDRYPRINNKEITTTRGVQLNEGDVIEVGENLAEISFVQSSQNQSRAS